MMKETEKETGTKKERTPLHRWFGDLFRVSLIPLGLDVETDHPVMRDPPEADVVITGRHGAGWTREQRERLPDGLRDTDAARLVLELKCSESLNEDAVCQAGGYHFFYKTHNELKNSDLQMFLISLRTPREATLKEFGYEPTEKAGVFRSGLPVCRLLPLISLNDLSDSPHNIPLKLFASKKKASLGAAERLRSGLMDQMPGHLREFLKDLLKMLFMKGGTMDYLNMTPEEREDMRQGWLDTIFTEFTPEEVASRLRPEDRLAGLRPEEVLSQFNPEEVLSRLRPEEIEAYLRKIKNQTEH